MPVTIAKKKAFGNIEICETDETRKTSKNDKNGKNGNKDENLRINLI